MIRTSFITLGLALFLLGCGRLPKPRFSWVPEGDLERGDSILFFNESKRSDAFLWDFGDGNQSREESPVHAYDSTGVFDVSLRAMNDQGESLVVEPLAINEATVLGFQVRDSSGSIPLEWARVRVFRNHQDMEEGGDPLYEDHTDREGLVEFRNLDTRAYQVRISLQAEEGQWLFEGQTAPLEAHRLNFFRVRCRWVPPA